MGTGDEDTRRFFKHSSVQVLLCPRSAAKGHSWVKKQVINIKNDHSFVGITTYSLLKSIGDASIYYNIFSCT